MKNNNIVNGAIISYFSIFLNIVISFLYTPWMIRQIGVSDYGLYSLVGSFLSFFLMDYGLSVSINRFISKYRAEGEQEKIENILGIAAKVYFIIDVVIFITLTILYFFLCNIFTGLTVDELERLKVLYCISGGFSVLTFILTPISGAMMAYEYFVDNKILDLVTRVGTVSLIIVVLLLHGDVFQLVFITGLVGFIVAVVRFIVFRKKSKVKINWSYFDKKELVSLFSFSGWVLIIQISQIFRINLISAILGVMSNTTEISIFSVGRNLEGFVYTISAALNGLFLPTVSRLSNNTSRKEITDLMTKVGRIQLFIIFLLFSGFIVFGKEFLTLWVGSEFEDAYYVFIALVFVNLLSLTIQIGNDLVFAENKIKFQAISVLVSSVIGLLIAILLTKDFGAIGCSIGSGIGLLITQLLFVFHFKKEMGLDMSGFFRDCHLKIIPVLSVLAMLFYFVKPMLHVHSWVSFCLSALVYAAIYFVVSYLLLMNNDEKQFVKKIMSLQYGKR